MNFKGKTAVIAGDAWGLGHATALMFAREGAQVICIDDNAETKEAHLLRLDEFELSYFPRSCAITCVSGSTPPLAAE